MAIVQLLQRSARPLVCLGLLSASALSYGAVAVPQVTQRVNNQQRVTLHGNVRPLPRAARDIGAVAVNTPASRVLLLLKRPAAQEAALQTFLTNAHTPGNPGFHKWLTPAQFGSQFGPADADVQAVVTWLQAQGFAVAKVSLGKTTIEFSGTAGQIEKAFATQIHSFSVNGETHVSNITDPQIPAALAPVVAGISPLNDFRFRPMHTAPVASEVTPAPTNANARAVAITPRNARTGAATPQYTATNGFYYMTPADVATIYNTPNQTLNRNYAANANLTGSGVTIGIAGESNVDLSNVTNYRSLFGLPALTPTVTIDGTDPGVLGDFAVEALLDLEVAGAVAPAANLNLYTAQDTTFQQGLILAIQRALDDNTVNILNVSFGSCEAFQEQGGNQQTLNFWEQAAAQGISVTVSTGDSGSAGCDDPTTETAATVGLQVNGLASTPFDIAVGGTDFNLNSGNISQYWSSTNSPIGLSALGPIPEIPWNDSTSTTGGSLTGNLPFTDSSGNTNTAGAGGGLSGCTTSSFDPTTGNLASCTASYASPSWQSGFGSPTARQLPDVSLFAADGGHNVAWALCASGLGNDQPGQTDCVKAANGTFALQGVGGTSAASPAFAGMLALVIQNLQAGGATGVRLGQAAYTLYPLSKQHAAAFHDVTTGNNSVVCAAGSLNCGANDFLTGYDAGAGYDVASGLGSVNATQMVQNWSTIAFLPTATSLQLNGSTSDLAITHGSSVNVTATVTSSGGGSPTGDLVLVNNGTTPGTAVAAVQGTVPSPAVFTLGSGGTVNGTDAFLPGGSYAVKANYNGDGVYGASVSNGINVTVSAEPSTLGLSVLVLPSSQNGNSFAANGLSIPYGAAVSVLAQPTSTAQLNASTQPAYFSQATGTVTFTGSAPFLNQSAVAVNSNGYAEVPGQATHAYPPGTYTVSASYSGDPSFTASTAAAQTFTISKAGTYVSSAATIQGGTLVVEVDPSNVTFLGFPGTYQENAGASLPTGAVTITDSSGNTVGTGTLANVPVQGGHAAQATVTLTTSSTSGLTINYPGDANYTANAAPFVSGAGTSAFSVAASPDVVSVASGSSGTSTVQIIPSSFSGTVSLSCAVTGGGTSLPGCSFAQASVSVSGANAVNDQLTISAVTTTGSAVHTTAQNTDRTWYAAGGVALAGMLLLGLPGRRRAWQRMLSVLLLFVAMGVAGCGGNSSSGGGGGTGGGTGGGGGGGGSSVNTPAGNYSVLVTATSGKDTQTSYVLVSVQ